MKTSVVNDAVAVAGTGTAIVVVIAIEGRVLAHEIVTGIDLEAEVEIGIVGDMIVLSGMVEEGMAETGTRAGIEMVEEIILMCIQCQVLSHHRLLRLVGHRAASILGEMEGNGLTPRRALVMLVVFMWVTFRKGREVVRWKNF